MSEVIELPAAGTSVSERKGKVSLVKAPQKEILRALTAVCGIVERHHTLPILANVLLNKSGDTIEIVASDLDLQMRTRCTLGSGSSQVSTTIGARKLIDILRSMPDDQVVSLALDGQKVLLTGGK